MISTQTQVALGVTGGLFLAYCVYFDHKRRSAPDFKAKLKAKREKQKLEREQRNKPNYPDMRDEQAVQRYFLEEIQLGEELMMKGEVEEAVTHLANACVASGQPMQIMQLLQQTLPPEVMRLVAQKYPQVAKEMMAASGIPVIGARGGGGAPGGATGRPSTAGVPNSRKTITLQDDDDLE